jgi:hypothetical protein
MFFGEENLKQKFDVAFGKIRSKQKLHIYFSLEQGRLKIWEPFMQV